MTLCYIINNTALRSGGGIRIDDNGAIQLESCIIQYNNANNGGGIYYSSKSYNNTGVCTNNYHNFSQLLTFVTVTRNCDISNNTATEHGGGLFIYTGACYCFNTTVSELNLSICSFILILYPVRSPTIQLPVEGEEEFIIKVKFPSN